LLGQIHGRGDALSPHAKEVHVVHMLEIEPEGERGRINEGGEEVRG
jgi:hypothetical protein